MAHSFEEEIREFERNQRNVNMLREAGERIQAQVEAEHAANAAARDAQKAAQKEARKAAHKAERRAARARLLSQIVEQEVDGAGEEQMDHDRRVPASAQRPVHQPMDGRNIAGPSHATTSTSRRFK